MPPTSIASIKASSAFHRCATCNDCGKRPSLSLVNKPNEAGNIQCPITGQWISRNQAHVDHAPPNTFERIVTDFIQAHTIDVDQVELKEAEGENEVGQTFADPLLIKNWVAFHDERASFRIVSQWANLSILKKEN